VLQETSLKEAALKAWLQAGLVIYFEDEGDKVSRNVGVALKYRVLHPKDFSCHL
jgi:hypothetical protein